MHARRPRTHRSPTPRCSAGRPTAECSGPWRHRRCLDYYYYYYYYYNNYYYYYYYNYNNYYYYYYY
jgi:hypothetical protein